MSFYRFLVLVLLTGMSLTACTAGLANPASDPAALQENPASTAAAVQGTVAGRLVIYSGRSEPLIQPVIDAFQKAYPQVEVLLKAGSNSELANALIEEQANPQADVFITTELFTVQSLAEQGVFQPYLPARGGPAAGGIHR